MSDAVQLTVAVGVTLAVSALNFVGVRYGAAANNLTAAVKVLALVAFAVLGPLFGTGDYTPPQPKGDYQGKSDLPHFGLTDDRANLAVEHFDVLSEYPDAEMGNYDDYDAGC